MAWAPGTAGSPVFALAFPSLRVLAETVSDVGAAVIPNGGFTALSRPKSNALFALCGMAATNACVALVWVSAGLEAAGDLSFVQRPVRRGGAGLGSPVVLAGVESDRSFFH